MSVGVDASGYRLTIVGFARWTVVVLVACTPEVGWSSGWASARSIRGPIVHGRPGDPCTDEPGVIPT